METFKQSGLWSNLSTHDSVVVIWWLCVSSSGKTKKFDCLNQIWPWRSRSIANQNNRDLNQAIFHLWSKFELEVKFDLEGQGQLPSKTIGTLTKVFRIFGPNLAILAWTGPELSHGQASDWHTDWHTHGHTHRRRRWQHPKAKTGLG